MNQVNKFVLVALMAICSFACKQNKSENNNVNQMDSNSEIVSTPEKNLEENTFYYKQIGWTISVPEGWTIVPDAESEANDEIGKQFLEQNSNIELDDVKLKNLVSFQKDEMNIFSATAEPFEEAYEGEYQENNRMINELIYTTFVNQGIKIDSSSAKETINGQDFHTYTNKIYAPDGSLFITQALYSKLINGHDFAINMAYDNDSTKAEMLNALKNSTFQ